MSRQKTLTFVTNSGGIQELKLQNYVETNDLIFYNTNYDEAIDGSLRSNVRDIRPKYEVSYSLCGEPDVFRSIVNNIVTDLSTDGLDFFYIGIDTDRLVRVTLDSQMLYRAEYNNQHGLFVPKLTMIANELGAVVEVGFEDWRFVNEAVTEARDYGLITDAVTTQIDYGTIV